MSDRHFLFFTNLYDLSLFINHRFFFFFNLRGFCVLYVFYFVLGVVFGYLGLEILGSVDVGFFSKPGSQIEVLDLQPWAAIVNFVTKTENR